MRFLITENEHKRRIKHLQKEMEKQNLDALYITSGINIFYLTGYSYITTERPAALIIPLNGEITFMGPLLERDHIPLKTRLIKNVKTYLDYPGEKHPIEHFVEFLTDMGLAKNTIGIDNMAGASTTWGYRGPPITEKLPDAKFVHSKDLIYDMRLIKSEEEIDLMRESGKWANLAHSLLQDYTAEGLWDFDVAIAASHEASMTMKKTLGPNYMPQRWGRYPASTGFRGQIGEMSAIPHSIATNRPMREGDILVTGAGADVGGYSCELERTMILGEPTPKQRKYFEAMMKAQEAAFKAFKPGTKCSDVDKAVHKTIRKFGHGNLILHHTGHGLGLEAHEPPWLDIGNKDVLKEGMIVSCEPGIYEPNFGGFRHSDTVLITEDGAEILTYYPRDIESLIIPT